MLGVLRRHFVFEHVELQELSAAAVDGLDVLLLCTTEGPALSESEKHAVRSWVERGGALIASAFSNWSAHNHFAADTVGWLGLQTVPQAAFKRPTVHNLRHVRDQPMGAALCVLLGGPFGQVDQFRNTGESSFKVLESARRYGGVELTGRDTPDGGVSTLVFYPPRPITAGGVTGAGRVLVCSNYHWLADPEHWSGGFCAQRRLPDPMDDAEGAPIWAMRPSQALLLNFAAGAVAARASGHAPRS